MKGKIQTVLGLIEPEMLGRTLMHEHVLCDIRPPTTRSDNDLGPEITLENVWQLNYGRGIKRAGRIPINLGSQFRVLHLDRARGKDYANAYAVHAADALAVTGPVVFRVGLIPTSSNSSRISRSTVSTWAAVVRIESCSVNTGASGYSSMSRRQTRLIMSDAS